VVELGGSRDLLKEALEKVKRAGGRMGEASQLLAAA
jgi:hypothetical protein